MDSQINYTTINHVARVKFGLTMNEYAVVDLIYNLANNPENPSQWCYASKTTIGIMLNLSEKSVHVILGKVINLGLVEKHPKTRHLRTTTRWYESVIIKKTEESSATLKNLQSNTEESSADDTEESSDNKDNIYKDNKNYIAKKSSSESNGETKLTQEQQRELVDYLVVKKKMPYDPNKPPSSVLTPVYAKQAKAIKLILKAGYTVEDIKWGVDQLAKDDFYLSKFDLMTVYTRLPFLKGEEKLKKEKEAWQYG